MLSTRSNYVFNRGILKEYLLPIKTFECFEVGIIKDKVEQDKLIYDVDFSCQLTGLPNFEL